jgi:predicted nucleic acid-binding protein
MIYIDSAVLTHAVEDAGPLGESAREALAAAGGPLAISALTRMECLVGPFKRHDAELEADYRAQFARLHDAPVDTAVFERAARLRADHGVGAQDAIQWAAAVAAGCSALLTADTGFAKKAAPFVVEVAPAAPQTHQI